MTNPRKSFFGPTIPSDGVVKLLNSQNLVLPSNSGFWWSKGGTPCEIPSLNSSGQLLATNGMLAIVQRKALPEKAEFFHMKNVEVIKQSESEAEFDEFGNKLRKAKLRTPKHIDKKVLAILDGI